MPRYINPFCDVGFKRIFGQEYSKPLLISFLNNALKNMEQLITNLPWAGQDSVFAQLATIADISSLTKEDRMRYDSSIKKFRDTINVMEGAKEEGFEKGMVKGIEKGRAEGISAGMAKGIEKGISFIAKNMKSLGFPVSEISKATGLTEEDINSL